MPDYDAVAEAYETHIVPKFRLVAEALTARTPFSPHDVVLEGAAGTGGLTRLLVSATPAPACIVVTDVSPGMLGVAERVLRRTTGPTLTFEVADLNALRFDDASFDCVVAMFAPLQESDAAVQEAFRVLKPGGRVSLATWGETYEEARLHKEVREAVGVPHPIWHGPSAAHARLERHGFADVQRYDYDTICRHDSVDAYISYRRSFGVVTSLPAEQRSAYFETMRTLVTPRTAPDGSLSLGWSITLLQARKPLAGG